MVVHAVHLLINVLRISYSAVKVHVLVQIKVSGCAGFIFLCVCISLFFLLVLSVSLLSTFFASQIRLQVLELS